MRRKTQGSSSKFEVFVIKNMRNIEEKNKVNGEKENSRSKSKLRCKNLEFHYCPETGHMEEYCFRWKKESKRKNGIINKRVMKIISYQMRACGYLTVVLHCILHRGICSSHLIVI